MDLYLSERGLCGVCCVVVNCFDEVLGCCFESGFGCVSCLCGQGGVSGLSVVRGAVVCAGVVGDASAVAEKCELVWACCNDVRSW